MTNIIIPKDVADHIRAMDSTLTVCAKRLDYNLSLWGDGETDNVLDDGEVYEWQVSLDHSEVERLANNLRAVAEFAGWLAQFDEGGTQ